MNKLRAASHSALSQLARNGSTLRNHLFLYTLSPFFHKHSNVAWERVRAPVVGQKAVSAMARMVDAKEGGRDAASKLAANIGIIQGLEAEGGSEGSVRVAWRKRVRSAFWRG